MEQFKIDAQAFIHSKIPVYSVIFNDSVTKHWDCLKLELKNNFWKVTDDIVPVLHPLVDITEILEKEDIPTGSGVYILLNDIFNTVLSSDPKNSGVVKDQRKKLKKVQAK